mgnify:CR=1 FL=1|tara:strand:+ start:151 stop:444 length:294 start_codon:yes stop_codon:yes gene_type:complete
MVKRVPDAQELLKIVLDQIAGEPAEDQPLVPKYIIAGKKDKMCYDPSTRMFNRVTYGTAVYIIKENYDHKGRTLVYTTHGHLVCVEPDELLLLSGFD